MNSTPLTQLIKQKARDYGFSEVGVSRSRFLEEEASRLDNWLRSGRHGKMSYLESHFDIRLDPSKLVDGAKSVISLTYNYFPEEELEGQYKISKYAYGRDYHKVIKKKLKKMVSEIRNEVGNFSVRAFVDSAPVMERQWAKESGLGWLGKNTLLINKHKGSFFFLAEIICDLVLDYDTVSSYDHCGSCTACIDACPTDAFVAPYELDASKCISYYTIELKENIPEEVKGKFNDWVFGCDVCQDVCPWNKRSTPHKEPDFKPVESLKELSKNDFEEVTLDAFEKTFFSSPIKRTQYEGFVRNLEFLKT